jgi:metal-responsive CopG/Arc/MetJ family transcriptional regulator
MKDLHVTLPDSLAEEADRLASDLGETRNGLLRRALEELIASERKRRIASEMKCYAESMARQSGEFVKATGASVVRKILKETRW